MTRGSGGIRLVANLLLLLAVTFFMVALLGKRVAGEAYIGDFGTTDLNTGWVLDGEKDGERITLPTVLQAKKGERILMSNTLPDDIGDGMRLCMRTALQDIYFYIDGELRGSYATEHFEGAGEYLPSSYVMIDLSDADAGKPAALGGVGG